MAPRRQAAYLKCPGRPAGPAAGSSGVLARDGAFYVIFDNLPHIARLAPGICAGEANRVIRQDQGHRCGFEDIACDERNGRYYVLIESLPRGGSAYMAKVQEYDAGFGYTGQAWRDFPLDRPNKGLEGLTCVHRAGETYLLGLCEGNRCRGGAAGRIPGGAVCTCSGADGATGSAWPGSASPRASCSRITAASRWTVTGSR